MNPSGIPEVLRASRHWVARRDKKPVDLAGNAGGWSSPSFWADYDTIAQELERCPGKFSGMGYIIARDPALGDRQIIGIDLDCCRDPRNGWTSPWALEILEELNSYTEISISGTGFHVWALGKLPEGIDSAESEGQDPSVLPEATWIFIQAIKKTAKHCNTIEIYEDGPRHFAMSGHLLEGYPLVVEYRQDLIEKLLRICKPPKAKAQPAGGQAAGSFDLSNMPSWAQEMAKAAASKKLPTLNILDVIDTRGWEQSGDQLLGPHPILGSSTGRNVVVNPYDGIWAYMHNGINSGGDAWLWLACECGAVKWEEAGAGMMRDRLVVEKTVAYAVSKQLVQAEEVIREPEIRLLKPDDTAGAIGIAPDGTVQGLVMTDDGVKQKWFSDCALGIHTQTTEDGAREFCFIGRGAKDGKKVRFTARTEDISELRKFRNVIINHFGANNRMGKLDFEMVQRLSRNVIEKERVTIPRWRKDIPLVPGVDLAQDVEYKLSQITPAAVYDGDIERAREAFRRILQHRHFSPLLIATILGSPVLARWFKNDRFGLALWGMTGSNKTTISQLYLAIYGQGFLDDMTMMKHGQQGGTAAGAMEALLQAGILPRIIDNVKSTDSKDAQRYIGLIQMILEGGEKLRSKREGGLRAIHEFLCTPIVTGEVKVSEAATSARMLNLSWEKVEDNGNMSWLQENIEVLPVIGYHWLRYLAANQRDIREGFDRARATKAAEYAKLGYVNPGRLANIYCLLRGIWALLEEGPFGDVAIEHHDLFLAVLDEAIAEQGEEVTAETEISRFLQAIQNLRASRPDLFMVGDLPAGKDRAIGRENDLGLFLFPEECLAILKQMGVFTQIPSEHSITKALKEEGLLRDTKGRRLNETFINGTKARGWWLNPSWALGLSTPSGDGKTPPGGNYPEIPVKTELEKVLDSPEKWEQKTIDTKHRDSEIIEIGNNIDNINREVERETNNILLHNSHPIPSPSIPTNSSDHIFPTLKSIDSDLDEHIFIDSIKAILKRTPRQEPGRSGPGLLAEELADRLQRKGSDMARILTALGWEQSKIPASGLIVYWLPEDAMEALKL